MLTEVMKKKARKHLNTCPYPESVNLYEFIRLILGDKISDRQIARRWKMNGNNFSQFKNGKSPVPRLERLEKLARMLGINKHLVFEAAGGASARKVFNLIRTNDLLGQAKLVFPGGAKRSPDGHRGAGRPARSNRVCNLCGRVLDSNK